MMQAMDGALKPAVECGGVNSRPEAGTPTDRHFARRGQGEEFEMEANWIVRSLPAAATRILDIGCGNGALISMIGLSRVVGLDFVHAGLRRTHVRFPESRLACGDGAALPFEDQSFDAITAQHVIEHMPDADSACREWRRVLRLGGQLVVVTPNGNFREPSIFDDPTHIQIFNGPRLQSTLQRNGFKVRSVCALGLPWFRQYHGLPGGWRMRRTILRNAEIISRIPGIRGAGQSLCCAALRSSG